MINQKYSTKTVNVSRLNIGDQVVSRTNGGSIDTVTNVRGLTESGKHEFEMNGEYPEFYHPWIEVEVVCDSEPESVFYIQQRYSSEGNVTYFSCEPIDGVEPVSRLNDYPEWKYLSDSSKKRVWEWSRQLDQPLSLASVQVK